MERVVITPDPTGATAPASTNTPAPAKPAEATPQSQTQTTPPANVGRPAWLPEKFTDGEALAKAYAELEAKQSKPAEAKPNESKPNEQQQQAAELIGESDLAAFQDEFAKNGKLSDETYAKLAAKGITKGLVDNYIEGQSLRAQASLDSFYAEAGGSAESYAEMSAWAQQNLPKEDIDAFNALTQSNDTGAVKLAIRGIYSAYSAAKGKPAPARLHGDRPASTSGVEPFQSTAQVVEAMRDPRYRKDEAYRQSVRARLRASNVM